MFQVFNATSEPIEIITYEKSGAENRYEIPPTKSTRIQVSRELSIRRAGAFWRYALKPIPKTTNFFLSEPFGALVVKFEVEADGTLYVLAPAATNVTHTFQTQPDGYPIGPK